MGIVDRAKLAFGEELSIGELPSRLRAVHGNRVAVAEELEDVAVGRRHRPEAERAAVASDLFGDRAALAVHILTELAEMCTSICVMSRGKLLASGTVDQVRQQLGDDSRSITVVPLHVLTTVPDWIRQFDGVADARIDSGSISLDFLGDDEAQANLLEEMLRRGLRVRSFTEKRSSYEEILIGVAERSRLS